MIAVIDSSVAVKWFVAEDDAALSLDLRSLPLTAPDLILAECANVFWKKVRRSQYRAADAARAVSILEVSNIALVPCKGLAVRALELSIALEHPTYDCFYLALAEQRQLPVVTADAKLAAAVARRPDQTAASIVMLQNWKVRLNVQP